MPEAVRWLWDSWLARGKFHVLAGRPGTGKTTLALAVAATIASGGRWPDGTRPEVGNVLIWSGEDDAETTLAPRLMANGADMTRVYFVGGATDSDGKARPFDPARDMPALEAKGARIGAVRLLIVDPIVSAVQGDGNSNSEVRRALQPVVDLAAKLDCAALGISHFTKGSDGRDVVERVTGSLAFGAAPRVVWAAAKVKDDSGKAGRILVRAKSNNGPDSGGFGYNIEQAPLDGFPEVLASRVLWGDAVEGTARELLRDAEGDDGDDGGDPRAFLAELLAGGALPANQVFRDAEAHGYSRKQMRTALRRLHGWTFKAGMKDGWRWALPEDARQGTEDAEDARCANQAPSPVSRGTFGEDDPEAPEDARHENRSPSASSAFAWRITRASGESFTVRTVPAATLAEMRERYPGAGVEAAEAEGAA
jgi:putative DNA primase/helicase